MTPSGTERKAVDSKTAPAADQAFGACWSGTFVLSVESCLASGRTGLPNPSSRGPERRLLLTDLLARPWSCGSADFFLSFMKYSPVIRAGGS